MENEGHKNTKNHKKAVKGLVITIMILAVLVITFFIILILNNTKVIQLSNLDTSLLSDLTNTKKEISYGDVNEDGKMDVDDVTLVEKYLKSDSKLDDLQKNVADVDGDKEVTAIDVEIMQKKIAGKISAFPVEDASVKLYTYGDVNEDNAINIDDVTLIQKYTNQEESLLELQKKAADVNGDSKVDMLDAEIIQKKIAGKISDFPIEDSKVEAYKLGDVNEDGKIDVNDATLIKEYLNGKAELSELQKKAADVNGDNKITNDDVDMLQKKIANLIADLTAQTKDVNTGISGDVNGDGILDINDATLIQKYVAGLISFTDSQKKLADVDGDGKITALDAEVIQKKIVGKISDLPIQNSSVKTYTLGDVNEDKSVNINDVTSVLKYLNGSQKLSELQKKAADVDGDGNVTDIDAEIIQRKIANAISKFPVEDKNVKIYTLGDVNEDSKIDNADVIAIQQYLAHSLNLSAIQKKAADYNKDGTIDIQDSTDLLRAIINNSRSF